MSSYGIWLSAAGMQVNEHRQTIIANNIANVGTTGFKRDLAVITQRDVESRAGGGKQGLAHPVLDDLAGGLNVRPSAHIFEQGPIERTSRPLDVAIQGEGFFEVGDGTETRYTRDGEFAISTSGELVLAAGNGRWRVHDAGGSPISFAADGGEVEIIRNGAVRQGETVVAQLALTTTANKQTLKKVGENLFDAGPREMTPAPGRIIAQSREGSNVNASTGMVSMIEVARAYQLNATMLQMQDQMTAQAVSTLGRLDA